MFISLNLKHFIGFIIRKAKQIHKSKNLIKLGTCIFFFTVISQTTELLQIFLLANTKTFNIFIKNEKKSIILFLIAENM